MNESTNPNIQLLTAKAVAKMLSLSPRTVWRYRSSVAKFPRPIKIGSAVRWHLSDIEKYIESKKEKQR
jgi:predicted DNA-binding transcriptional regulator AlpA